MLIEFRLIKVGWESRLHEGRNDFFLRFGGKCATSLGGPWWGHKSCRTVSQIWCKNIDATTWFVNSSSFGLVNNTCLFHFYYGSSYVILVSTALRAQSKLFSWCLISSPRRKKSVCSARTFRRWRRCTVRQCSITWNWSNIWLTKELIWTLWVIKLLLIKKF